LLEALPFAARLILSVLSQQILQDDVIQHRISQQTLQLCILVSDRTQLRGIRYLHATILRFEFVKRTLAETMFTAHVRSRHPSFLLFDHPNYLGFAKSALSHLIAPSKG
jgi:hypothetical protein